MHWSCVKILIHLWWGSCSIGRLNPIDTWIDDVVWIDGLSLDFILAQERLSLIILRKFELLGRSYGAVILSDALKPGDTTSN